MKSFNCSDFTGKSLVFWRQVGGSLQEVVMEVRLLMKKIKSPEMLGEE